MAQTFSFPNYGLFNATYYLQQNPDVATSWTGTPLQHYIQYGALEGRAPTAWFNADFYRQAYTDLQSMNALQLFNHYCNYGYNEGRVPVLNFSNFNGARYLLDNPDVAAAGYTAANAVSHFAQYGEYEGRVAYATNGVVIEPIVNQGETYTLTTGLDNLPGTQFNDTYDASLGAVGSTASNTLQSFDSVDGMGGVDTIYAQLLTDAAPTLKNLEVVNVAVADAAATLNLVNAAQVTNVNNNGSVGDLWVRNIAAGADLSVNSVVATSTQFDYANVTGTQTVDLTLNNVEDGEVVLEGVEVINTTSTGDADNSVALVSATATTLNFDGEANLAVSLYDAVTPADLTPRVTSVDASTMTGNLDLTFGTQSGVLTSTDITVVAGLGDDIIDTTLLDSDYTASLGLGDDELIDDNITTNDTVNGGLGYDTLTTSAARAAAISAATPTTYSISNMDELFIDTALAATTVNTVNIDTNISAVTLGAGGNGTLQMKAGTVNVLLEGALNGTLTVTDTGTAIVDTVNIVDLFDSTTDAFANQAITINGYENVNLDTTEAVSTDDVAQISTLTVNADGTGTTVNIDANADAGLLITSVVANTTGRVNIDASGVTAATGGTFFTLGNVTTLGAATATVSVTGSVGADSITSNTYSTTVEAGAGNDVITGSGRADNLHGDTGNDTIYGGGGNDVLRGGAGDDTIKLGTAGAYVAGFVTVDGGAGDDTIDAGNTLDQNDVIDGGTGTNTLAVTSAILGNFAGATNIQTLRLDATGINQNLARYTGTTLQSVAFSTGTNAVTGAAATLDNIYITTGNTSASVALADPTGTSDEISVGGYTNATGTLNTVILNGYETVTFNDGKVTTASNTQTIGQLTGDSMTDLVLSGAVNKVVTAITAANLDAINASANTGTVVIGDGTGTTAVGTHSGAAFTGSATAASSITGSAGADTITGGAVADKLFGMAGADTIYGGAGNDSITGGAAGDYIDVGVGTDTIVYTAAGETDTGLVESGTTVLSGFDSIVNTAAGDVIDMYFDLSGAVGTSLLSTTSFAAGAVSVVRGNFNSLSDVFTVSTTGTDTLVQAAQTLNTDASIQNIVLVGYATAGEATITGGNLIIG